MRAYDAGDYATAYRQWLPLADAGDLAAQRNLGHLYETGKGVPQDPVQAAQWYRKAADAGLSRAQANLAVLYLKGEGTPADDREAAQWFHRAALQGHVIAEYNLGLMYEAGRGVERDLPRALGWLHLAAKAGYQPAQEALQRLLEVSPPAELPESLKAEPRLARTQAPAANPAPAVKEPVPAAKEPVPAVKEEEGGVGGFLRGLLGLGRNPPEPPAAVREGLEAYRQGDPARAKAIWEPAANAGDPQAQYYLGGLYRVGAGVPPDRVSAYLWWRLAARGGHAGAKKQLVDLTAAMWPAEVAEGERRLGEWKPTALAGPAPTE